MNTKKVCGCGHRTKNPSGICDNCLGKVRMLNRIRTLLGLNFFQYKKKKTVPKTEPYLVVPPSGHTDQLCWYCEKACGRCSWSRSFKPIEGWEAVPTKLNVGGKKRKIIDSFYIKSCPQYEPLKMVRVVGEKVRGK